MSDYLLDVRPARKYAIAQASFVFVSAPMPVGEFEGHVVNGRGGYLYWADDKKKVGKHKKGGYFVYPSQVLLWPVMKCESGDRVGQFAPIQLMAFPSGCAEVLLQTFQATPKAASVRLDAPKGFKDWAFRYETNVWRVELMDDVEIALDEDWLLSIPSLDDEVWWQKPEQEGGTRWELYSLMNPLSK